MKRTPEQIIARELKRVPDSGLLALIQCPSSEMMRVGAIRERGCRAAIDFERGIYRDNFHYAG